jgi:hypothetical protein
MMGRLSMLWKGTAAAARPLRSKIGFHTSLTVLLGLNVALLATTVFRDSQAARELVENRAALAEKGGGVMFILHPADCVSASDVIHNLANQLGSEGIAVLGLVLRDGISATQLETLLERANRTFPHAAVRRRAVARLAGLAGHIGTPIALLVGPGGRVLAIEPALERRNLATEFGRRLQRGGDS